MNNKALVCFIGEDCNKVVRSKYGSFFGIPNEVLGIAFYLSVALLSAFFYFGASTIIGISVPIVLLGVTGLATIFAIVLFLIQMFVLKEYCTYCLLNSFITIAIFVITVIELLFL